MQQQVLDFWFKEIQPKQWWVKDQALDQLIQTRFSDTHQQANNGELFEWRNSAQGRLAEIIVLDQFSRNMYRDTPKAFASDSLALILAQEAYAAGANEELTPQQKGFLFMPYMHSESLKIHELAVSLFKDHGLDGNYESELQHKKIIEQFGRYPHRNAILGRTSSAAEIEFLKKPGSSF